MKKRISLLFLVTMFALLFATAVSAATPSKVTGVKQTAATSTSIKVEWDSSLEDVYYEVSMSTDGVNYTVVEDRRGSNYYSKYDLNSGSTYYVKIRALYYSAGSTYGAYSDVLKVVTAPENVENVVQTGATTSSLTISWDKVAGATSYVVYKKQDGSDYVLGKTTGTSYTVTGLSNKVAVPFNIYVYPVNSSGTFDATPSSSRGIYSSNLELVPGKVQNLHTEYYYDSIKKVSFDCDKQTHAEGYEYQLLNYKGKKIGSGTFSANGYNTLENIKVGQFYRLKARAYVTVNDKTIYGEWSDVISFAQQPKVNIKRSGKKLKFSWKKVKGAKSYTVYVSTSQKSGYKKVATTKKTKYTLKKFKKKKLNSKKTYYVYVVANTKVGKKKFKSNAESCWYLKKYYY